MKKINLPLKKKNKKLPDALLGKQMKDFIGENLILIVFLKINFIY